LRRRWRFADRLGWPRSGWRYRRLRWCCRSCCCWSRRLRRGSGRHAGPRRRCCGRRARRRSGRGGRTRSGYRGSTRRCGWRWRRGRARSGCRRRRSGRGGRWNSRRFLWRVLCCLCCSFLVRQLPEMLAHEFGVLDIERTRVRLLLRDADLRQVLDQHLGLDFKLASELVNSNLVGICHSFLNFAFINL
jgi:hypothetical protein